MADLAINNDGLNLIKSFEGFRSKAYQDENGIWTIGYGHTRDVKQGSIITLDQGLELLKEDIRYFEDGISRCVKVSLNENEFSALVCLSFNIGLGAFETSALLLFLNLNERGLAANQFIKWIHEGSKEIKGLIRRRLAEKSLFMRPALRPSRLSQWLGR